MFKVLPTFVFYPILYQGTTVYPPVLGNIGQEYGEKITIGLKPDFLQ